MNLHPKISDREHGLVVLDPQAAEKLLGPL